MIRFSSIFTSCSFVFSITIGLMVLISFPCLADRSSEIRISPLTHLNNQADRADNHIKRISPWNREQTVNHPPEARDEIKRLEDFLTTSRVKDSFRLLPRWSEKTAYFSNPPYSITNQFFLTNAPSSNSLRKTSGGDFSMVQELSNTDWQGVFRYRTEPLESIAEEETESSILTFDLVYDLDSES